MEYTTLSQETVSTLKGASARENKGWTFIVYKGKSYAYKGTIQELRDHKGAFELSVTCDEDGKEYGHCHLAETL